MTNRFFAGQTDYIEQLNALDVLESAGDHIADTTGAHAATAISNTPAGNIAATTVQEAINELDTEKLSASATTLPSSFVNASLNSIVPYGGAALYVGDGTQNQGAVVRGPASGVNNGAAFIVQNGGASLIALGNKSALVGGAYDATPMLYGNAPIEVNRSLSVTGSISATSLVDISAAGAGQIKFPATQNASADANTLDDYEEGSWAPSISFGGGSTGVTYSLRIGRYTKTGNEVTATTYIVLSSKGSDVGTALCEGLPFVSDATGGFNQSATIGYENNITVTGRVAAWVAPGSSSLLIGAVNNGAAAFLSDTAFANNSELMITFTYKV
jgi:hypothetical protein